MLASLRNWCLSPISIAMLVFAPVTKAIVTLDGTLGSAGSLTGPNYAIPAEVGQTRGANLFHSFGQFSLTSRESATFNGPRDIQNIIGRVTGGEISNIDGLVRSSITSANLYLINPSGVMFGPNARLDVSGSFYASTADYLRLADGGRFDARNLGVNTLSLAPPAAFGFLGGTPAPISMAGQLSVATGQTLGLIGGDIMIEGDKSLLDAASGRIDLIAVRSAGELRLSSTRPDVSAFNTLGDIVIGRGALVSTVGDPGGTIYIRGGRLTMESAVLNSSSVGAADHAGVGVDIAVRGEFLLSVSEDADAGDGSIESSSFDAGRAGDIRIQAGGFRLTGDPAERSYASEGLFVQVASQALGSGRGGDVVLNVKELEVGSNASIITESLGAGDAGDITVNANSVRVDGSAGYGSYISTSAHDVGNAGSLTVSAGDVLLRGGENALAGLIVEAIPEVGAARSPNAGTLALTADRLRILGSAEISTASYVGGSGGNIHVTANDILIAGQDAGGGSAAGIFSSVVGRDGSQDAGNITVTAANLIMSRGGEIGTQIDTTFGARTGNIVIAAQNMELSSGARVTSLSTGLAASDIAISATRLLLVGGGGENTADKLRGANAGIIAQAGARGGQSASIHINSRDLQVLDGARIDTSTFGIPVGGSIRISADRVLVAGRDAESRHRSSISATSGSSGRGGDIDIAAREVVVRDHGEISVASFARGDAGNLRIVADTISLTANASLSAASTIFGNAGNIELIARNALRMQDSSITTVAVNSTGGNIDIQAGALIDLDNSSITSSLISSLQGSGAMAGDMRIAADNIFLTGNSALSATGSGGDAGNIDVIARDALRMQNSTISTGATQSAGGNINIVARSLVYLNNSAITSSVQGRAGNGGNITIDPDFVVLNHSRIAANAFGGNGGSVAIVAGNFLASSDSSVTASSTLGLQGNVVIRAPTLDLSGDLEPLPETAVDASTLFKSRCTAVGSRFSSFTVAGPSVASAGHGMMLSVYSKLDTEDTSVLPAQGGVPPAFRLAEAVPVATSVVGCRL